VAEEHVAGLVADDVQLGVLLVKDTGGQGNPQAAGGAGPGANRGGLEGAVALVFQFRAQLIDAEGARYMQCLDFFLAAAA
jgi:hypothetical protein